jgi:hypothetical protein
MVDGLYCGYVDATRWLLVGSVSKPFRTATFKLFHQSSSARFRRINISRACSIIQLLFRLHVDVDSRNTSPQWTVCSNICGEEEKVGDADTVGWTTSNYICMINEPNLTDERSRMRIVSDERSRMRNFWDTRSDTRYAKACVQRHDATRRNSTGVGRSRIAAWTIAYDVTRSDWVDASLNIGYI